jgi:hypothetical protein
MRATVVVDSAGFPCSFSSKSLLLPRVLRVCSVLLVLRRRDKSSPRDEIKSDVGLTIFKSKVSIATIAKVFRMDVNINTSQGMEDEGCTVAQDNDEEEEEDDDEEEEDDADTQ